jgi:hypothetical protein
MLNGTAWRTKAALLPAYLGGESVDRRRPL